LIDLDDALYKKKMITFTRKEHIINILYICALSRRAIAFKKRKKEADEMLT